MPDDRRVPGRGLPLVAGCLVVILLAVLGTEAVLERRARAVHAAPGRLVAVDGVRYDLYCTGSGAPTVVLDSGLGESLVDWQLVQPMLAARSRVCSYDRAGLGWSEDASYPRDAARLADTLAGLLERAGEPGPYVLVAHSLAGLTARMFAARHHDRLAGLVLVDASSPDDDQKLPPQVADQQRRQFAPTALCSGVTAADRLRRALGLDRLSARAAAPDPRLPAVWQDAARAADQRWLAGRSPSRQAGYAEYAALPTSAAEVSAAGGLGDLPLAVVSRGMAETWPDPVPVQQTEQAWRVQQDALAGLSRRSVHLIADAARHHVQIDQPQTVVDAVSWVLSR